MLERLFHLAERGTTAPREILAGLVTFLAMAYIVVVNPQILGVPAAAGGAGMSVPQAVTATCLASAGATLLMALLANYPFALAPGMGLNALFSFWICGQLGPKLGFDWRVGLGWSSSPGWPSWA